MHPYLPHLLDDIKNAHRIEQLGITPCEKSFEEEMEEIEKWCEGEEHDHTFGYYCGLESGNFPPPEQFTKKEIKTVIKAFNQMMLTWNHGYDFPKTLPVGITYSMLVNTLNEKTFIPNSGFTSFDCCSGYAPDCIFKEYCPCLKIRNEPA